MPEVSISPMRKDGIIEVKIVMETDPLCPDAICSNCGGNLESKVYECQSAEEALDIVRIYTEPESYRELWDARRIFHVAERSARELAQFLVDHPQYSDAQVAEWLERDEAYIEDLRQWAKNGFKGERPWH